MNGMNGCNCLNIDKIHVCKLKANAITAESIVANDICTQTLRSMQLWSDSANLNSLCVSGSASINELCVNKLRAQDFEACNVYRAAATYGANTIYTLGQPVNWDVVLDDPNSNVTLAPFRYTVDAGQSGYYMLTFNWVSDTLAGADIIVGTPTGLLTLLVNGNLLRQEYVPFLAFSDAQRGNLSSIALLNAGDVITMKFDVLVQDSGSGFIPYVGTVSVKGNAGFPGESGFAIIQLSTFCADNGQTPCSPCPIVTSHCSPVSVPCCVDGSC